MFPENLTIESVSIMVIFVLSFLNLFKISILYISSDLYHIYNYFLVKKLHYSQNELSIAVVIPAHNEETVIYRTLESVFANKYNNYKVYVVDDGSTDNTKKEIERFKFDHEDYHGKIDDQLFYIHKNNSGKAESLNHIIKNHAKEDLIMCLDADCIIDKNAIGKAIKYFCNPQVGAMISNVKIAPMPSFINFVQRLEYLMGFYLKKGLDTTNMEYIVGGAGSVFRKTVLEQVGYYDSDTITEDIDLSMKIIKNGKQNWIVFGNDVIVHTQGPTTFMDLFKQRYRWKLGWLQTILKNKSLIFNINPKYNWSFTLYYLPYMLFAQLMFILDPIFVGVIIYYSIMNQDFFVLMIMLLFYYFLTCLAIIGDDYMNWRQKAFYLFIAPMSYVAMTVVSFIEYGASIKCLFNWKKIIFYKRNKHLSWSHVQRVKH